MSNSSIQIGTAVKPARQRTTIRRAKPLADPSSAATHPPAKEARDRTNDAAEPNYRASGLVNAKGRSGRKAKPNGAPTSPGVEAEPRGPAESKGRPALASTSDLLEIEEARSATETSSGTLPLDEAGDRVVSNPRTGASPASSALREIVDTLVHHQRYRRFAIKGQQICDRRTEALIASEIGYSATDQDEKRRTALFKRASSIRSNVEKEVDKAHRYNAKVEKPEDRLLTENVRFLPDDIRTRNYMSAYDLLIAIINSAASRHTWDAMREKHERSLEKAAEKLPVHEWAKSIKGFGDRGLSIVVAEAAGADIWPPGSNDTRRRMLGEYRTVSGLWKRMGLAVIDGERQRKKSTKAGGMAQGYQPERRAECWVLADSLLRAQMCSEIRACRQALGADLKASRACEQRGIDLDALKKMDQLLPLMEEFGIKPVSQYATGPYGEVYMRRRAHTASRIAETAHLPDKVGDFLNPLKWTKGRCHSDAARIMFKALLRDLWVEWRRVAPPE